MHSSKDKTKKKYEIGDLPKFFKNKSKDISKAFSSEVVEISTIRSRSIDNNKQELSFKLKLSTAVDENISNTILPQIKHFIDFFKICLSREKNFTVNIKVPKESEELYNSHHEVNNCKTVEEFISNAPLQILLQGITITLQTDVANINLDNLHKIESSLNEKLNCAEETEGERQSQDTLQVEETENKNENMDPKENIQDKQIVPAKGSFGCNVTNSRKQVTRAPIVIAAMRENVSWLRSFFHLPNFFSTVQFFFRQPTELSVQKHQALTCQLIRETKQNERAQENEKK